MSDAAARTGSIRIDIVSDVVCPWCVIGYLQLERALEETGLTADLHWHPFELNPSMPPQGQNLREHIAAKYGATPEQSRAARDRLTELGAEVGFTFAYTDDMRMVNTFLAHQLLTWADERDRQTALKLALFEAYFTRREDVSDPAVLTRAAESVGLDATEARAVLDDGRFADAVRAEEQAVTSQGVHAVPTMVFEHSFVVPGAQGTRNYVQVLSRITGATR